MSDTLPLLDHVFIWTPGGSGVTLPLPEVKSTIAMLLEEDQADKTLFYWETRAPGVDPEINPQFHRTLLEAVNDAMPCWQEAGIDQVTAAFLAITSDLVLSTGIQISEEEDEA